MEVITCEASSVRTGYRYKSYLGDIVTVIAVVEDEDTGESLVNYNKNGTIYSMSLDKFTGNITLPRFKPYDSEGVTTTVQSVTGQSNSNVQQPTTNNRPTVTAPSVHLTGMPPLPLGGAARHNTTPTASNVAPLNGTGNHINQPTIQPSPLPSVRPTTNIQPNIMTESTDKITTVKSLPYPNHPCLDMEPLDRFLYWIKERHNIYLKRKRGLPKPWTNDPILRDYFFCNPYRENDKVTTWFRDTIREPMRDDPRVIFATIAFRWFNYIPTGEFINDSNWFTDWRNDTVKEELTERSKTGAKIFTGAFTISPGGVGGSKINHVCDNNIQPIWEDRIALMEFFESQFEDDQSVKPLTMQAAHTFLQRYPGMGGSGFMAYEVICDLRYTRWLENAPDKETWCNPGPGAIRGMNRIHKRKLEAPIKNWTHESQQVLLTMQKRLNKMPSFEMRECEHALCEMDKYDRILYAQGHSKRKFKGS